MHTSMYVKLYTANDRNWYHEQSEGNTRYTRQKDK